jgi:hypothetical protein
MNNVWVYAKAIVAVLMAGVTSALAFFGPDTSEFKWLTVISAMLGAVLVYLVPNQSTDGKHEAGNGA